MALKTCPHCKKPVSDTVKVCIHCGNEIDQGLQKGSAEPQPMRRGYENLTDYERRELEKEFVNGKPKYGKFFGKEPAYQYLTKISKAGYAVSILLDVIDILFMESMSALAIALYIIGGVLLLASVACDVAFYILQNKYRKQLLIVLKKYQKWLSGKNIDYVPNFQWLSDKWKSYFKTVNADMEDI
ncbi:MAG: zinc ribbon domain-containing protein [Clostridiales bacterium]|nr:zinc ribbon domain-containing protein [Clostridiales bacterium]